MAITLINGVNVNYGGPEFNSRITLDKGGPGFESVSASMAANGNFKRYATINPDIMKAAGITLERLTSKKTIPPIFVYVDRKWIHVRVSHREFKTWKKSVQTAFMNSLPKVTIKNSKGKLIPYTWKWIGIHRNNGYIACTPEHIGWGNNSSQFQKFVPKW